jgi:hypothetical protein
MRINFTFPTVAITLLGLGLAQSTDDTTRQIAIIGASFLPFILSPITFLLAL